MFLFTTGLCLEKLPPNSKSKYKIAEWQEQIIKCYEITGDLTLVYLQEQEKLAMQHQNGTSIVNSNNAGDDSFQHILFHQTMLIDAYCSIINEYMNNILIDSRNIH